MDSLFNVHFVIYYDNTNVPKIKHSYNGYYLTENEVKRLHGIYIRLTQNSRSKTDFIIDKLY